MYIVLFEILHHAIFLSHMRRCSVPIKEMAFYDLYCNCIVHVLYEIEISMVSYLCTLVLPVVFNLMITECYSSKVSLR